MCFYSDGYADFFNERFPTAKKPHTCEECGRRIEVGEVYRYASGVFDGDFWTFKGCADCERLRIAVHLYEVEVEGCDEFDSWCPMGSLMTYLRGYSDWGFDDGLSEEHAAWVFERHLEVIWPPVRTNAA